LAIFGENVADPIGKNAERKSPKADIWKTKVQKSSEKVPVKNPQEQYTRRKRVST